MRGCRRYVTAILMERENMYEIQDILDFANMVFSMSSGSTDFAKLLP